MSLLLRQLSRNVGQTMSVASRRHFWHRPTFVGRIFDDVLDNMERIEREIAHISRRTRSPLYYDPFRFDSTSIVEENGVKKFKIEFDVRRFKPEEVSVITKNRELTARYNCTVSIPEGVEPKAVTCKYLEGKLTVEAPYEPPAAETIKETEINVKHE
uniref:SHSP domain-containing protein n=1 Tax=Steinernema glaseri TaxID=37863 RepID=A0A1I7YHL1_9BILA